ncbi:hypothetical protein [Sporosarcina sp. A2]
MKENQKRYNRKTEGRGCLSDLLFAIPDLVVAPFLWLLRGILAFIRTMW